MFSTAQLILGYESTNKLSILIKLRISDKKTIHLNAMLYICMR